MTFVGDFPQTDPKRLAIEAAHGADETACVVAYLPEASLEAHAAAMARQGRLVREAALPPECVHGTFFAPRAFEIESMAPLEREVFGPILHVIAYSADRLDAVIDAVNGTGFGLTLGIHSRIDATQRTIHARLRVGNAYVNRNMIGGRWWACSPSAARVFREPAPRPAVPGTFIDSPPSARFRSTRPPPAATPSSCRSRKSDLG